MKKADYNACPIVDTLTIWPGLTKRELFAAMAMQDILSARSSDEWSEKYTHWVAKSSIICGDALLKELENNPNPDPVWLEANNGPK